MAVVLGNSMLRKASNQHGTWLHEVYADDGGSWERHVVSKVPQTEAKLCYNKDGENRFTSSTWKHVLVNPFQWIPGRVALLALVVLVCGVAAVVPLDLWNKAVRDPPSVSITCS